MYQTLAVIALFALFYSMFAGRFEKTILSGPLMYVMFGFLMGSSALGIIDLEIGRGELRTIADLTLALVLFTDASNANFSVLRRSYRIPERMLLLGLPLTIVTGFAVGTWVFEQMPLFEVAILATMLAATDAAMAKAVISNTQVPANLREGLNLESGLNDGICVPILFLFAALAVGEGMEGGGTLLALDLLSRELGIGLLVGLGLTSFATWVLVQAWQRGWVSDIWSQVPVAALALANFSLAHSLHGSGYIAAFSGGLLFGYLARESRHELVKATEGVGETLALVTWVVFGAAVVGPAWQSFSWQVFVYAVLSLTVIRMLPMYMALRGTGESPASKLFVGWFGPRGLASIVFAIIVLELDIPNAQLMASTVVCTVLLSVLAHGISANPLARMLAARQRVAPEPEL